MDKCIYILKGLSSVNPKWNIHDTCSAQDVYICNLGRG